MNNLSPGKRYALIVCLVVFAAWIPLYISFFSDVNSERLGCERLNTVRIQVYEGFLNAKTGAIERGESDIARGYNQAINELLESTENLVTIPGTVNIDCNKAYRPPFPFNVF